MVYAGVRAVQRFATELRGKQSVSSASVGRSVGTYWRVLWVALPKGGV